MIRANTYRATATPKSVTTDDAKAVEVTVTVNASDAYGNAAAAATAKVKVKRTAAPVGPTVGAVPATYANGVTTIGSATIGAHGFVVIPYTALPDLHEFFTYHGVTITLHDDDTDDDKNVRTVVISEILWGYDDGELDVAGKKKYQFIEAFITRLTMQLISRIGSLSLPSGVHHPFLERILIRSATVMVGVGLQKGRAAVSLARQQSFTRLVWLPRKQSNQCIVISITMKLSKGVSVPNWTMILKTGMPQVHGQPLSVGRLTTGFTIQKV